MGSAPAVNIEPKPLSQAERVIDTFVAPTKIFNDLRRSANWIVPWLLMAIVSTALVVVVDQKLGMRKVVDNQLALAPKQSAQLDKLREEKPDQYEARMETAVKFNRVIYYMLPVLTLIFLVIIAGVLLGTFNFGFGAELGFNQSLAVCVYASLPGIIKALIAILVVGIGGAEGFTFQNPVASNLSGLVDPSSHFLHGLAMNLDLFMIWTLVLSGIGFSCLTKVKRSTSMAVVFGWWVIFALGASGIGAAFS